MTPISAMELKGHYQALGDSLNTSTVTDLHSYTFLSSIPLARIKDN